jgi:hypothetical protein
LRDRIACPADWTGPQLGASVPQILSPDRKSAKPMKIQYRFSTIAMPKRPKSSFDGWAAGRMQVEESELTTKNIVEKIPRRRDLLDGPNSPMLGRIDSHLDSYSDTEFDALVCEGEELLGEIRAHHPADR